MHQQGTRPRWGHLRVKRRPVPEEPLARFWSKDHNAKCNFKLQSDVFFGFPTSAVPLLAASQASLDRVLFPAEVFIVVRAALMFESLTLIWTFFASEEADV